LYADYQHERHRLVDNDGTDFVFINLYKTPVGEPMKYQNAKKMFERVSKSVGFAVRPHMFRHTAATRWVAADTPRDVVQELLGHASPSSMNVYLHATDQQKRAAVEKVAALGEVGGE
jgi:integrase/recombinase XerD